jgi:hypothetical protein
MVSVSVQLRSLDFRLTDSREKQAGDIVAELKAGIALKAFVVRGGQEKEIEARDLVPGDIVCCIVLVYSVRILTNNS